MLPQGSKVTGLHAVISVDSPLAILWIVDNEIPTSHAFEQLSLVTMPLSYPIIILSVANQPPNIFQHFLSIPQLFQSCLAIVPTLYKHAPDIQSE